MDANSCGKGWWPTCFPTVTCPSSAKVSTKHCCAIFSVIVLTSNFRFLDVDVCAFENLTVCVFRGPLLSSGDAVTGEKNGRCESNTRAIDTLPENQHAPKLAPRQRTKYHHVLHGDWGCFLKRRWLPVVSRVCFQPFNGVRECLTRGRTKKYLTLQCAHRLVETNRKG